MSLDRAVPRNELAYSSAFYREIESSTLQSAQEIAPLVVNLVRPRSVIDVGCGTGAWLTVFKHLGVERVLGIDGDWVSRDALLIAEDEFVPGNLAARPPVGGYFDLAVCMEVAEHLVPDAGDRLIDYLTSLAPVVLFSAAIPGQGGVNHINEQWPGYWIERFRARGYLAADWLRPLVWQNSKVAWYYAQNALLFAKGGSFRGSADPWTSRDRGGGFPADLVHPEPWLQITLRCRRAEERICELEAYTVKLANLTPGVASLRRALNALPRLAAYALRRRLGRLTKGAFKQSEDVRRDRE